MKIVFLDGKAANPGDLDLEGFRTLGEVVWYDTTPADKVIERAKDADAILLNKILMTRSVIEQLPNLRYIGVQATGFNVVDLQAAREHGIVVTNVPAYSTDSVAQQTFAHILNISNRVAHYAKEVSQGAWCRSEIFCYWNTPLIELANKHLGIIGYGNIGRKVEEIAKAFGMQVTHASARADADQKAMDELLATSDIITFHCPATEHTTGMINADFIARMKQGAIIINTARGQLANEHDIAQSLSTGRIGAYGTDSLVEEPAQEDNPLLTAPNCYITPHNAWGTLEARSRLRDVVIENLRAWCEGKTQNQVN